MTHKVPSFVGVSSRNQEPLSEKLYMSIHLYFGSDAPRWCALTGILRDELVPTDVWLLTLST